MIKGPDLWLFRLWPTSMYLSITTIRTYKTTRGTNIYFLYHSKLFLTVKIKHFDYKLDWWSKYCFILTSLYFSTPPDVPEACRGINYSVLDDPTRNINYGNTFCLFCNKLISSYPMNILILWLQSQYSE